MVSDAIVSEVLANIQRSLMLEVAKVRILHHRRVRTVNLGVVIFWRLKYTFRFLY